MRLLIIFVFFLRVEDSLLCTTIQHQNLTVTISVISPEPLKLGEGPHWDPKHRVLWLVDVLDRAIIKLDPTTKTWEKKSQEDTVSFVIPRKGKSQELLTSVARSYYILDWPSGNKTKIAEVEPDLDGNRMNDGKCDALGRAWSGTMPRIEDNQIPANQAALYRLSINQQVSPALVRDITISNGLDWSLDKKTMYHIDSLVNNLPGKVYAFDYDEPTGNITNRRVVLDYGTLPTEFGVPDGLTVDSEGKLWVACAGGARIIRVDPDSGTILQTLTFPSKQITSMCFGGETFEDLFVTSGTAFVSEEDLKKYPQSGHVFRVTGLGVKGRAANEYGG